MSDEFIITPRMSEISRKKAEDEALENAQKVVEQINEETEQTEGEVNG